MIAAVIAYVYALQHAGVTLLVFIIQALMYSELVRIALVDSKEREMPAFHLFYWHWFLAAAFFMYMWTLQEPLQTLLDSTVSIPTTLELRSPWNRIAQFCIEKYVPLSFGVYMAGFVAFVFSLRQRHHFRYQFGQLGFCHMALVMVVFQSTFLVSNTFQGGLLWFFLPVTLVVVNDSFAYIFGFFLGRTPLIRLSPKKTWEGFIGGAFATLVAAIVATALMQDTQWLACPWDTPQCDIQTVHDGVYAAKSLAEHYPTVTGWLIPSRFSQSIILSRMQIHALVMAVFASAVAPFGGFFASGFKRAFKIKDFSQAIPGHGGFTDRMDCQIVMGFFVYIYARWIMGVFGSNTASECLAFLAAKGVPVLAQKIKSQLTTEDVNALISQLQA